MAFVNGPINRPILTTVIFLVIIVLGVVSFSRLSIDLMPEITYPTISVVSDYGNVGPQEMEELVTRPLEETLAAVQGVELRQRSEPLPLAPLAKGEGKSGPSRLV